MANANVRFYRITLHNIQFLRIIWLCFNPAMPVSAPIDRLQPIVADPFMTLSEALLDKGFRGDVSRDHAARAAMSTDNSVYELMPDLVVAPRDEDDVILLLATMAEPRFRDLPITGRGGGTGTNGQSLNRGVIVNFQRFMTRVLAVNVDEGWAEVEPGVVLDELNAALADKGLFFAPNTSTATRCTIGGMVGTDASGKGSRIYGKTSENIVGLSVVLEGGRHLCNLEPPPDWAGPLLAELAGACDAGRDALITHTPRINRRFTGYDLERARPDGDTLEWWRLFLGAEGTLGMVTRIRVRLVPAPKHKRLVVVAFGSFRHALLASASILTHEPLAIEVMDEWVSRLARDAGLTDALPPIVRGEAEQPVSHIFVEFVGEHCAALDDQAERFAAFAASLPGVVGTYMTLDPDEQKRLWGVRAAAVGLLSKRYGRRRPVAFIEDSVVPVEHLVPFVDAFDALMREHGLAYGIYGHIDVGCLHVRPALDLDEDRDRAVFQAVSDAVYALCKAHGGIFWGEHGKGIRGTYLPDFVGPEAYAALQRVKRAFDPCERFNPGKLVVVERPRLGIMDLPFRQGNAAGDIYEKSFHCNGNAACLGFARTAPMCPSYQATRDNRQSPKGRADALRQWRKAQLAADPHLAEREDDVFDALNTCLSCNACASRCPVQVSIPAMKSAFLDQYYQTRRRPLREHLVTTLEAGATLVDAVRPLARLGMAMGGKWISTLLDMCDAPAISRRSLRGLGHRVHHWNDRSLRNQSGEVLVLADPFTIMFDVEAIGAVCDGLVVLGYAPVIITLPPGAKSSHVLGLRQRYEARARRQIGALARLQKTGLPMLAVDPAFALLTRQEYRHLDAGTPQIALVQEFLATRLAAGDSWARAAAAPSRKLMAHCTELAALPGTLKLWRDIFDAIGVTVQPVDTGCCGMAGLFGHEMRNQQMSRNLFDASWARPASGEDEILATGFSCRCQVERFSSTRAVHPMKLIADALAQ
ncbi:FAD-binding and (Fe-S)-binding domain-containing protein [Microbaculum marinisediminis]|uniref:FAD-binding oxidoreductase n=1 Tax=Microbaculum marinisediminis TaxID=2931392 RepID=A0AAW5R2D6_9HYPH|nr:FAD-binding and (Fe-S)-binding domain-containing protein [Microbaculum sp. A6E488]MCT8973537.1 FAD-binding oxidoreductase [Microbaculum sp. A6E488]